MSRHPAPIVPQKTAWWCIAIPTADSHRSQIGNTCTAWDWRATLTLPATHETRNSKASR